MDEFIELVGQDEINDWLKSDECRDGKIALAEDARDYWKSISPVGGEDDPHAGEYRDDVKVIVDDDDVSVGTDLDYDHIIEYGSVDTAEFACRARVEEHFG